MAEENLTAEIERLEDLLLRCLDWFDDKQVAWSLADEIRAELEAREERSGAEGLGEA